MIVTDSVTQRLLKLRTLKKTLSLSCFSKAIGFGKNIMQYLDHHLLQTKLATFFFPVGLSQHYLCSLEKPMKSRECYQRINSPLLGHYTHGRHNLMKKYIVLQAKKVIGHHSHYIYGLDPVRYLSIYLKVAGQQSGHLAFAENRPVCAAAPPYFQNLL